MRASTARRGVGRFLALTSTTSFVIWSALIADESNERTNERTNELVHVPVQLGELYSISSSTPVDEGKRESRPKPLDRLLACSVDSIGIT